MTSTFQRTSPSVPRRSTTRAVVAGLALGVAASLLPVAPAQAATPTPISASFFGVTDHNPAGTAKDGWPRGPVGSIRLWDSGVTWRQLEVSKGVWNFSLLDRIVKTARAKGARPLLVLGQSPRFHATHPGWVGFYGAGAPTMPRLTAWRRYVAMVAQRYGTRVDYQVWNEPNVAGMWRGTPYQMARLTMATRNVLDDWAPKARLVAPSFPTRLAAQRSWISRYFAQRAGGKKVASYVDAVSLNLYPAAADGPEASMSLLRSVRGILSSRGVHKPVWNTEINYGMTGHGDRAQNISRRHEAANVTRTYVLNGANRVKRVYWYSWDLHGIANTEITGSNNAYLTKAGRAYRVVAGWLVGAKVRGCSVSGNGTYTCTASYPNGVKRIYWNPAHRTSVRAVGSATRVEQMLGADGKLHGGELVAVNYAPVMVRSRR